MRRRDGRQVSFSSDGSLPIAAISRPEFQRHASIATSSPSAFHETDDQSHYQWNSSPIKNQQYTSSHNSSSTVSCGAAKSLMLDFKLWKFIPCLLLIFAPWVPVQTKRWSLYSRQSTINSMIEDQKNLVLELDSYTTQIRELRLEVELLSRENDMFFHELRTTTIAGEARPDFKDKKYLEIEKEEEGFLKRIDTLEKQIQKQCSNAVQKQFGIGPHLVRVTIKDDHGSLSSFVIQMAHLTEMPHAVHHFLKMVKLHLWDGLAIHSTGTDTDVIMATPLVLEGPMKGGSAAERFQNANVTHMAFTEYSPTYPPPHDRKYSVAFSGRPGGPDFYISMNEDIKFHEHESTFGVVVKGQEVLDRFFEAPSQHRSLGSPATTTTSAFQGQTFTIQSMVLETGKEVYA